MWRRLSGMIIVLWCVASAHAEPQFGVLFGQSCFLCHANPTGRAMRSLYGSQFFAPTYLPPKPIDAKLLERIKPQLSESVTIGADLRTILMDESSAADSIKTGLSAPYSTNTGTASVMAADLYLALRPSDQFELYYAQNLFNTTRYEAFGQANVLPLHGFAKVGKFQENYGWAFSDHTAFVRTGLWSGYDGGTGAINPPVAPGYGVGAQVGFRPKPFDITASYTDNADAAYPGPMDMQKRWFARAMVQHGVEPLRLQFTAGGSWYHMPAAAGHPLTKEAAWGGFAGIGWQGIEMKGYTNGFGFLTTALLFEYDRKAWTRAIDPAPACPVTSAYSTTQLSVMVCPGVWVLGAYDWMDNNEYSENPVTGSTAQRNSFGLQLFPLPWIDVQPIYRLYVPSAVNGHTRNIKHGELQVHFLF